MTSPRTAAALIIGNELLTGKIRDSNTTALAQLLFRLGIRLRRVVHCPDEVEIIAEDLNALSSRYDFVVTSGGVGPTHDDVTLPAVAQAFGRPLTHSSEIEALLREFFGSAFCEGHQRMSQVPEGFELVRGTGARWPVLKVKNVFVLPGLPNVFRHQLEILRQHLPACTPFISRAVHTLAEEGEIAELLAQITREFPSVEIGSYPRVGSEDYRVAVTFDGCDPQHVERAVKALCQALPSEQIVPDSVVDHRTEV